ncbi:hypothetical protein [Deinococcus soli (ex Cha et al. 2016)]|uniref:Uncharacterized protein n=2 Tax=Deinococcus soli (ex Cha et al. 2016) TaxID=1309411 RepID=A0AAE3XBD1_9DEIO|nr:hypothetical protein [Deinococcus soli (ex Cha et al. 2016)]MDR6218141.1 hypothetical protein [Deinococcus soli (ex Cha et al. 2016)]MDR6328881.1 hypothetical protein [Deinococcus soli (ex Cha et al. 2016)]MDR6751631.1 hypothetical protein [Deinococcus soli (ex Cha et al. 2016)]
MSGALNWADALREAVGFLSPDFGDAPLPGFEVAALSMLALLIAGALGYVVVEVTRGVVDAWRSGETYRRGAEVLFRGYGITVTSQVVFVRGRSHSLSGFCAGFPVTRTDAEVLGLPGWHVTAVPTDRAGWVLVAWNDARLPNIEMQYDRAVALVRALRQASMRWHMAQQVQEGEADPDRVLLL